MAQQTAVQWLLEVKKKWGNILLTDLEQAKAMEKEQIVKAFNEGMSNSVDYFANGTDESEQYYNETYNK
jgi:predicted secreted protein